MDRGRRAMPVQNKACHERHVKKCQDNHRQRLAKMKPTIDCHAPSSMRKVAAKTNAKKQQIMVSEATHAEVHTSTAVVEVDWSVEGLMLQYSSTYATLFC